MELEPLLQPISEDEICGVDLSFSNEFHEIKKARTEDDPLLDLGDWVAEPKQADWGFVASKSATLLKDKTKDIRLLTWISEAWGNLYGFEGIARGLELSCRMLDQYWLKIHPEIEDDDLDQRLGLLQGLANQVPTLIKKVPLLNVQPFYSIFDYEKILHQQNVRLKNAEDSTSNISTEMEEFDQALFNTSKSFQFQNYQHFIEILEHWDVLKQVLDQLMELEAPSFAAIDSQLDSINKTLRKIYKADAFDSANAGSSTSTVSSTPVENANSKTQPEISQNLATTMNNQSQQSFQPQPQSHLQNREQAMKVLQEIADYFQANEPHSPVSYMLQKTIKWSHMPLHEWLAQVIKNDNPLESVQELLGVQTSSNESNDW